MILIDFQQVFVAWLLRTLLLNANDWDRAPGLRFSSKILGFSKKNAHTILACELSIGMWPAGQLKSPKTAPVRAWDGRKTSGTLTIVDPFFGPRFFCDVGEQKTQELYYTQMLHGAGIFTYKTG